jgi:hypothetical protein
MTKYKTMMWLCMLAGVLWIIAGIRDLFAPGFFNMSGRAVTSSSIALNFVLGLVFLIIGGSLSGRIRNPKNKS